MPSRCANTGTRASFCTRSTRLLPPRGTITSMHPSRPRQHRPDRSAIGGRHELDRALGQARRDQPVDASTHGSRATNGSSPSRRAGSQALPALSAQAARVRRHVRPAFVDDADHAERRAHAARSRRPFGRSQCAISSPTGSSSAAISSKPWAIAAMRASSSASRSRNEPAVPLRARQIEVPRVGREDVGGARDERVGRGRQRQGLGLARGGGEVARGSAGRPAHGPQCRLDRSGIGHSAVGRFMTSSVHIIASSGPPRSLSHIETTSNTRFPGVQPLRQRVNHTGIEVNDRASDALTRRRRTISQQRQDVMRRTILASASSVFSMAAAEPAAASRSMVQSANSWSYQLTGNLGNITRSNADVVVVDADYAGNAARFKARSPVAAVARPSPTSRLARPRNGAATGRAAAQSASRRG